MPVTEDTLVQSSLQTNDSRQLAVLIVRLSAIGDVIHTLPIVDAIRQNRPEIAVDWLVEPTAAPLLRNYPGIRSLQLLPRLRLARNWYADLVAMRRLTATLRACRYDQVLDCQGLWKSAIASRLAGGKMTWGFHRRDLRERSAGWFYSRQMTQFPGGHVIERNLQMVSPLGIDPASWSGRWSFPPATTRILPRQRRPYMVLLPGAGWSSKKWPAENFRNLTAILGPQITHDFLFTGSKRERLTVEEWLPPHGDGDRCRWLDLPLAKLPALLAGADLVVGGDTGPLHLAVALDRPVVGLYGPTLPARNGPWNQLDRVLVANHICGSHGKQKNRNCQCMISIPSASVARMIVRILKMKDNGKASSKQDTEGN